MPRFCSPRILGLVLALTAVAPLMASDGRFEINETCVATGCFPGDTAGIPVTITTSGSYVLTSSFVTAMPLPAIEITAPSPADVDIDLNGFTLHGFGISSLTGNGVRWNAPLDMGVRSIAIRNGTVREFGGFGISISGGVYALIEGVVAVRNGGGGIFAADGQVYDSVVSNNIGTGISADLVSRSSAVANSGVGIQAASVSDSNAFDNSLTGISGIRITNCTASGNHQNGFAIDSGLLTQSVAAGNDLFGLSCGTECGYGMNFFANNNSGGGGGVNVGGPGTATQVGGGNVCDTGPC